MPKFRKKPIIIEAEQFFLDRTLPFKEEGICLFNSNNWYVETLEGPLNISNGDWIIKGISGEYYPCKPDIFEKTYELVKEDA